MSGIEIPEEPTGIGSIIRVVFKEPLAGAPETFYVGAAPGWWIEYDGETEEDFTWRQLLHLIEYDEVEAFEVVYEGLWASEMDDIIPQHIKDWIWREGL